MRLGGADREPVFISLEFARAEKGGDPYAFRLGQLQYLVRSSDGAFETAELNWDSALQADLDALQVPRPDRVVVQRMGETLRRFLQPAGWVEYEVQIQQALQSGRRVVLTLSSAAAELYALPWELITLKGSGQHLAELPDVILRYEWPGTSTAPAQVPPSPTPGRILMCWSADAGEVPASRHIAAIQKGCERSPQAFVPDRDVLAHMSLGALDEALAAARRRGPPIAALHILCHGGAAGQSFGLALHSETPGERAIVDAGRLRQLLHPHADMIRLVVLAACSSGNSGALGNELGSVAQALHRAGLANVVASRYPLSVAGSIQLTEVLYQELMSDGGSLEQAALAARHVLARDGAQLDWASLQLYARASDPAFQQPSYLRPSAPPAATTEPASPATTAPEPAAGTAPPAGRRARLRLGLFAGGALLLAGALLAAVWPDSIDEGPIVLQNGKCLSVDPQDFEAQRDGGQVEQAACRGEASQQWRWDGRRIRNHNGLCLEVWMPDYQSGKSGGRIQVAVCDPKLENQLWQYNNREVRSYKNKCLSVALADFSSGKSGGAIEQSDCTGKPNQWFGDGRLPQ